MADATAAGASNSGGSCDAGDSLWPLEMSKRAVCSKDIRRNDGNCVAVCPENTASWRARSTVRPFRSRPGQRTVGDAPGHACQRQRRPAAIEEPCSETEQNRKVARHCDRRLEPAQRLQIRNHCSRSLAAHGSRRSEDPLRAKDRALAEAASSHCIRQPRSLWALCPTHPERRALISGQDADDDAEGVRAFKPRGVDRCPHVRFGLGGPHGAVAVRDFSLDYARAQFALRGIV